MPSSNPIGVFDSGVGGLSVLREIRRQLPQETLLYVADSAYAPYGDKSAAYIEARSVAISHFLLKQQAKAIVVACNTATGAAVSVLRRQFKVPIIAMEPAIKPAAAKTKTGVIGVLATSRTLASDNFGHLYSRFGAEVEIIAQACPGLVEQVEAGDLTGSKTRTLLERYVHPLLSKQVDTIVLGCTHYPFLTPLLQEMVGLAVTIIDPAPAIARELYRRLADKDLLTSQTSNGNDYFWSSGSPEQAEPVLAQLWRAPVRVDRLPAE
ncbi:MAG: glutamate racemase [Methylococcales bacterium]